MNKVTQKFIEALKNNQDHKAIELIRTIDNISESKDKENGKSVLHFAIEYGRLQVVRYLIQTLGADIEDTSRGKTTPLHLAAENDHLEIVEYLIAQGANIEAKASFDNTPLHLAALKGFLAIVQSLSEQGANIESEGQFAFTPLHLAAKNGHLTVIKYLKEQGANIEATKSQDSFTPLHLAALNGHLEVIQYLQEQGVNIEAIDNRGNTPMHLAAESSRLKVVKYLKEQGASIESKTKYGDTILHTAAKNGHIQVVKYLTKQGADIEAVDQDGATPLHFAAKNGHIGIVKHLKEQGADIETPNKHNYTPLHFATHYNYLEIIKYLKEQGANIDYTTKLGHTPLHIAAYFSYPKVVRYLKEQGADIEATDRNSLTPLTLCAIAHFTPIHQDERSKTLKELIIQGAELDFSNITFNLEFKNQSDGILNVCNSQQKIVVLSNILYALTKHPNSEVESRTEELLNILDTQITKVKHDITQKAYNRTKQIEICEELNMLKQKIKPSPITQPYLNLLWKVVDESLPELQKSEGNIFNIIFDYISTKSKYNNDNQTDERVKPNIAPVGKKIGEFTNDEDKKKLSYNMVPNSYAFSYVNKKIEQQELSLKSDKELEVSGIEAVVIDHDSSVEHSKTIGQIYHLSLENA